MGKRYPGIFKDTKRTTKDGRSYYYTAYYKDPMGNPKRKVSKMYKTPSEAYEEKLIFLMKRDNPTHKNFHLITMDYFNDFKTKRKDDSYYTYLDVYNNHIKNFFERLYIDEISYNHIKSWKEEMQKKEYTKNNTSYHYSINFLNKCYNVLNNIYKYAMPMCNLNTNIVSLVGRFENKRDKVIKDEEKLRYITIEDFNILIDNIDDIVWKTFFIYLMYTGCRKGEVRALLWEDVDFNANTIAINKQIDNKGKVTNTKGRNNRKIKMSNYLKESLIKYKNEIMKYSDFKESWYVFGCVVPVQRSMIDRKRQYYFKKANLPPITNHEFRHSHVSMLINEYVKKCNSLGLKIDTYKFFLMMSDRMGHTIDVMQKTYMHLFPTIQDEIVDLLDSI